MACALIVSVARNAPFADTEALAAGIPVIATPVGDIADLVHDGKTGKIVRGHSPEDLSRAILEALEDAGLRERARIEGPRIVEAQFSVSAALDLLIPMYRGLVTG